MNKIAISLTIVFLVSLVVLLAEFLYVLWRRRFIHRRSTSTHQRSIMQMQGQQHSTDGNSQPLSDATSANCIPFSSSYSKELLYFYLSMNMNNSRISRVQPNNSAPPSLNSGAGSSPPGDDDLEAEVIDVFKLQNMYGPPRFLFTIKEEERENDTDKDYCSDKEKHDGNGKKKDSDERSEKLEEFLKDADYEEEVVVAGESVGNEHNYVIKMDGTECEEETTSTSTTPFSTPCESPLYYFTPSASPCHPSQAKNPPSAANYCEKDEP